MIPRHRVPLAILAVLTLLTAGAAVLAVSRAPRGASQAVQTAAAASFGADSFSLDLTSSVSAGSGSGGTLSQVRRIDYASSPPSIAVSTVTPSRLLGTEHGIAVAASVHGYLAITAGSTPWAGSGSHLTRAESFQVFYQRVYHRPSPRGTVLETAVVSGGLLVYVNVKVTIPAQILPGGRTQAAAVIGETLHLRSVNGAPVPPFTP